MEILAGETKDGELYFLEIEPKSEKHDYFSMSGFTVKPVRKSDAITSTREHLEDGELWKMAVECDRTTLGLHDWVEEVLAQDELDGFDNSLFTDEIEVDDEVWLFESRSCGQHEEDDLARYYIPEVYFRKLMKLWKECHMKADNPPAFAGVLDDLRVEEWTKSEKRDAFIIETIKNL